MSDWKPPMYHREGPVSYVMTAEAARRVAQAFTDGRKYERGLRIKAALRAIPGSAVGNDEEIIVAPIVEPAE